MIFLRKHFKDLKCAELLWDLTLVILKMEREHPGGFNMLAQVGQLYFQ